MSKKTYSDQLKDPLWQKKRLEVLALSGWKCHECSDTSTTLHVHHRYYVAHRMAWEYPPFCYQVLCETCHEFIKERTLERRSEGAFMFEEWEAGLDYFGDKIFDMWAEVASH